MLDLRPPRDAHFITRLARLSPNQRRWAVALHRRPELVGFVLDRLLVPAYRYAFAIEHEDAERGPFVIVQCDGRFITCLEAGMSAGRSFVVKRWLTDALAREYVKASARP